MNERFLLSHNDMDGAGCALVLETKFQFDSVTHSRYIDIIDNLKIIDENITVHTKSVFITDLMFKDDAFIELFRLAMNHPNVKFIYIDHHSYADKELELLNKFKKMENSIVIHDESKCATKLCFEFINSDDEDLYRFVRFVNAYDIYLEEQPEFRVGFLLNNIFWSIKMNGFKFAMHKNNFKIPKSFITLNEELIEKKNKKFKQLEEQGLIIKDEDNQVLLAFSDTYKSDYIHDYPGYKAYVLPYQSNNNISVRFRDFDEHATEAKEKIMQLVNSYPNTVSAGGHEFAFGITISDDAPKDDIFMLIDAIILIVSEYTNPKLPGLNIRESDIPF